jgi:hypothetical protein
LLVRDLRDRSRIPPLSLQCIECYFGWGGHVARMKDDELIRCIMRWRPLDWFRRVRSLGVDDAGQRVSMMRVGRPTRWEGDLADTCGDNWAVVAQDRRAWSEPKLVKLERSGSNLIDHAALSLTCAISSACHTFHLVFGPTFRLLVSCGVSPSSPASITSR